MNYIDVLTTRNIGTLNAYELYRMIIVTCEKTHIETDNISLAIDLATILHTKQTRRNRDKAKKSPYIEHPMRNTLRLLKWGVTDTNILIASMLHDAVEDGSFEYCKKYLRKSELNEAVAQKQLSHHIRNTFGSVVASTVKDVTNPISLSSSPTKNEDYKQHVKHVIHNNPNTMLVKYSDYVDNAIGITHSDNDEFITRQKVKYRPLLDIFESEIHNLKDLNVLPVSSEGYEDMLFKIDYAKESLK